MTSLQAADTVRRTMSLHSRIPGTSRLMTMQPLVRVTSIIASRNPGRLHSELALP